MIKYTIQVLNLATYHRLTSDKMTNRYVNQLRQKKSVQSLLILFIYYLVYLPFKTRKKILNNLLFLIFIFIEVLFTMSIKSFILFCSI